MKQSGLWSSLATNGSLVVIWWLCISSSGETRKFDILSQISPWRSRSIATQNNSDLNQALLHLWSKFWDPSLNGELWYRQAQNGVNSDFYVNFDLKGQGQLPFKRIEALTKVFCIFDPNWVILAWTGPELSGGQASDWHRLTHTRTQTHTHRRRQQQLPKAKTGLG